LSAIAEQQPCDIPSDIEEVVLKDSKSIRNAIVTNVDGEQITIGDMMGTTQDDMTSVVVFLRHMGWPYCWTYANEWQNVQPTLNTNNVLGPYFVSIGDTEKLRVFLEKNPKISRNNMFVDSSSTFDAYTAQTGFISKFTDTSAEDAKKVKMNPPSLNFKEWITYFTTVGKVSPIPKELKFGSGVPEGVLKLGGTFVVKGNNVLYQWNDRLPGDHPDIKEVLSLAIGE